MKSYIDEEKRSLATGERFVQIKDRPRIAKLVEGIPNAKYATLGFLANVMAIEIYKEMTANGLYLHDLDKLNPVLNSIFDLFRTLKDGDRKAKVVVNHLGTLLGIKIVADPKLTGNQERKELVVTSLQLDYMQEGLDDHMHPHEIDPGDFFDRRLNKDLKINGVDTNSYYVIVRSLEKVVKEHKDDPYVISWCAAKLRQLEQFEDRLKDSWLKFAGVKPNKRLTALRRAKQTIYRMEKTKIKS